MPSPFTSPASLDDALELAEQPRHPHSTCPHRDASCRLRPDARARVQEPAARRDRREHPGPRPRHAPDGAVQQVRRLLLTTGNKSELAVGYCTLYGDMCGGLAVISDVPKTMVYRLSPVGQPRAARSSRRPPSRSRPSAELRPDRPIRTRCRRTTCSMRSSSATSRPRTARTDRRRRVRGIDRPPRPASGRVAEFKRRQAAPGLKVTTGHSAAAGACRSPAATGRTLEFGRATDGIVAIDTSRDHREDGRGVRSQATDEWFDCVPLLRFAGGRARRALLRVRPAQSGNVGIRPCAPQSGQRSRLHDAHSGRVHGSLRVEPAALAQRRERRRTAVVPRPTGGRAVPPRRQWRRSRSSTSAGGGR